MQAGKLNRRITIQVNTPTQDATYGTEQDSWGTYNGAARIPAEIKDSLPSKSEATKDDLRVATQRARVRIRYRTGITSEMRIIVHGESDTTHQIVAGPAELGFREGLEFTIEKYSS